MKTFLVAASLLPTTNIAINLNKNEPVIKWDYKLYSVNTKVDIINKTLVKADFSKKGARDSLINKQPISIALNEEMSEFLAEPNNKNISIKFNYKADFITDKLSGTLNFKNDFDRRLKLSVPSDEFEDTQTLSTYKGNIVEFVMSYEFSKIMFNEKGGKANLVINPRISFFMEELIKDKGSVDLGYLHFYVDNISITGETEVIHFENLKNNLISLKYDDENKDGFAEKWIRNEFTNWAYEKYKLPKDIWDIEGTIAGAEFDLLNDEKPNYYRIKVVTKPSTKTTGAFVLTIGVEHRRMWQFQEERNKQKPAKEIENTVAEEEIKKDKPLREIYEDTSDDLVELIKIESKKSNPIKYLWLLLIPATFGIGSLITWLRPFIRRKRK